ncbi:MAG: hypothetical protein KC620_15360 [Myxococcales bacterium]|nr:hypothetical protein [Myxococcales bacterium]
MGKPILRVLPLCVALFALPAQAISPEERAQAKAFYDEAVAAFKSGDFETALARFEASHALEPTPVHLYNMARANEELGRPEAAVQRYEDYLALDPNASDREEVERRVRVTRAFMASGAIEPAAPSTRPLAYGLLGAGGAGLLVGVIGTVALSSAEDDYKKATTPRARRKAEDAGEDAALAANVGWVCGIGFLAAGVALWLLEPDATVHPASTAAAPAGLSFTW